MSEASDEHLNGVPRYWDTFLGVSPGSLGSGDARVILIPVPYDSTTSYKSGSRDGPNAIITASRQLEDYDHELDREVSDVGIYTVPAVQPDVSGPESMVARVEQVVSAHVKSGALIGILGGEHTVAIGAVNALYKKHPDLSVLYMDAHADMRDEYMGTRWGHASVARRLLELCPVVEVGVRSLSIGERHFIDETELPVVFWPTHELDVKEVASRVLESLSQHVYISVDLDVFDPSAMAAVGNPEPGGMNWHEVIGLLRCVAGSRQIVGFDITELSPGEGPEASAFTAAKLAYKLIGYATEG